MNKILIYTNERPSDEVREWADEQRRNLSYVHFRSEPSVRYPLRVDRCTGFVSDNDEVIEAYEAAGVERLIVGKAKKAEPVAEPEVTDAAVVDTESSTGDEPDTNSQSTDSADSESTTGEGAINPDDEGFSLKATDEELKAFLDPLDAEARNAWFAEAGDEELATYLVDRVGRERKNWKTQQMGNMIEKHLGLS